MGNSNITYILPPDMYKTFKEAHPELVKAEWDGTEVMDGIHFAKSTPVFENRAMRRAKRKKKGE